ncbi:MAG TPA: hypothetical protein VHR66_09915 [Gemmataceae bacterium]|jgi:hypothetical protein|nr:hypothetical protein [Gemmataceae bacterium]
MMRGLAFCCLTILAVGCDDNSLEKPTAEQSTPAGKPGADEAKACIVMYLNQCGWKDVDLARVTEEPSVPAEAKSYDEVWAFTFTAQYTNVVGERQTSENWIAVVRRSEGKATVKCCFDESRRLVGGHAGTEKTEKVALMPSPPADDLPPIVAPKP